MAVSGFYDRIVQITRRTTMRLPFFRLSVFSTAVLCALASPLTLATDINAEQIGKSLTAAGSSVEAQGQIPKYEGNEVQQTGWAPGKNRLAAWKYRSDVPVFTIDASNVAKYASQLSPGQVELLKTITGYKM